MTAITMPHKIIQPGRGIPMILEGTLVAVGSDGGANYSLMKCGTANNQAAPCTDVMAYTGAAPIGFINEHSGTLVAAGEQVTVFVSGVVWAVAGAAITKGKAVMSEAATQTGRVVTVTDGNWAVGIALDAAGAEDDMIPVLIHIFSYEAT
jgi:ethanolamine utilization microcompartment shell protein EutS